MSKPMLSLGAAVLTWILLSGPVPATHAASESAGVRGEQPIVPQVPGRVREYWGENSLCQVTCALEIDSGGNEFQSGQTREVLKTFYVSQGGALEAAEIECDLAQRELLSSLQSRNSLRSVGVRNLGPKNFDPATDCR